MDYLATPKDMMADFQNDAKEAQTTDVEELLRNMAALRNFCDRLSNLTKEAKALLDNYKKNIVPTLFEDRGIGPIVVDSVRYSVSTSSRTSIPAEDKLDAYQWLRDNGLEDLITETVNASTLSATAKTLLEEGIELPSEFFTYYTFNNTSMTSVK
jgi:hypothetical protein